MSKIKRASVQYNDLKGTIAIDFHGGTEADLWIYARSHGVDTDRYTPIGLSFYIGTQDYFSLKFICIDKSIIEEFKQENEEKVPVVIFQKNENFQNFLNQIKRFHAVLRFKKDEFEPHVIIKEIDRDGDEV